MRGTEGQTDSRTESPPENRTAGFSISCVRTVLVQAVCFGRTLPLGCFWSGFGILGSMFAHIRQSVREQPDTGYRKSLPSCFPADSPDFEIKPAKTTGAGVAVLARSLYNLSGLNLITLSLTMIYFLEASTSAIFMARTFKGRPKRVIKPLASWWS